MRPTLLCRRPAVSMMTTSASSSAAPLTASNATAAGSAPVPVGADRRHADALAPGLQLVGRGGAERVGRAEDDVLVLGDEDAGELADGGRLAGAVDADDDDDGRAAVDARRRDRAVHGGSTRVTSSSRSQPRTVASSALPWTLTLVRRASTSSVVASTPRSAVRRVSSTSSQACSSRSPRESRASRPWPRAVLERASRARRRCRRVRGDSWWSTTCPATSSSPSSASWREIPGFSWR